MKVININRKREREFKELEEAYKTTRLRLNNLAYLSSLLEMKPKLRLIVNK